MTKFNVHRMRACKHFKRAASSLADVYVPDSTPWAVRRAATRVLNENRIIAWNVLIHMDGRHNIPTCNQCRPNVDWNIF